MVLREVSTLNNVKNNAPILFVRKNEYSSYFYGGVRVTPHAKEPVGESMRRGFENSDTIFVMPKKYLDRISEKSRNRLKIRIDKGDWLVATVKQRNENEKCARKAYH